MESIQVAHCTVRNPSKNRCALGKHLGTKAEGFHHLHQKGNNSQGRTQPGQSKIVLQLFPLS